METRIIEIAQRIKGLREMMDFSIEEMAEAAGVTADEYQTLESGQADFSVTVLWNCAEKFGVELVELMTGENPRLSSYSVVRAGKGLNVTRRKSFQYEHLAFSFKHKISEPFLVSAPYSAQEQDAPIHLSTHEGQEFDFVIKGSLKITIDGHIEFLSEGDAIYYDSSKPHGMIATSEDGCTFLAVVMKVMEGEGRS